MFLIVWTFKEAYSSKLTTCSQEWDIAAGMGLNVPSVFTPVENVYFDQNRYFYIKIDFSPKQPDYQLDAIKKSIYFFFALICYIKNKIS